MPSVAAAFMTSHGTVCSLSCLSATGRMCFDGKLVNAFLELELLRGVTEIHFLAPS